MQVAEQAPRKRGFIELALYDAKTGQEQRRVCGDLIEFPDRRYSENAVLTVGRAWQLVHMLSGEAETAEVMSHIALGTGTTAPATSESALVSEFLRVAVGTWNRAGTTATAAPWIQAQIFLQTNQGNTTLGELGLVNSSTAGVFFNRATFATVDKTTSQTLGATLTLSN